MAIHREVGPWEIGNMGTVGRVVTIYVRGPLGLTPVADWEDAPPDVEREYRAQSSGQATS